MIHVKRENPPACFSEEKIQKKIKREIRKLHRMKKAKRRKKHKYVYTEIKKEIDAALLQIFHNKCAYCESPLNDTQMQVEHYRPKSKVHHWIGNRNSKAALSTKGYYWLACDWDNLLPSCAGCNHPTTGKGSWFPLSDEKDRSEDMNDDLSQETPLLLNPCTDCKIESFLSFDDNGNVSPVTSNYKKAKTTIELLGLQDSSREQLIQKRSDLALRVLNKLKQLEKKMKSLKGTADQEEIKEMLKEIKKRFMSPDAPYSQMTTQIVKRFIASI